MHENCKLLLFLIQNLKNVKKIAEKIFDLSWNRTQDHAHRPRLDHGALSIRTPGLLTSSHAASVLFEMKHALTAGSRSVSFFQVCMCMDWVGNGSQCANGISFDKRLHVTLWLFIFVLKLNFFLQSHFC